MKTKTDYDKDLPKLIKDFRLKKNLSLSELAGRIGVCERSIYRWEIGEHLPKSQFIRRRIRRLIRLG